MIKKVELKIKADKGVQIPEYKSEGASGFDLCANKDIDTNEGVIFIVPTGLYFEVLEGYEVQIRSRSSLASHGVCVANSPGTIDSDYRGEIQVILINLLQSAFTIKKGDRIAQGVLAPVVQADFVVVDKLSDTVRGEGGLGSTGIKS